MTLFETKCAGLRFGRDWYRQVGWSVCFAVVRRKALEGELRWRLTVELFFAFPAIVGFYVRTWPAWVDEPTALAEYNRTMRRAA